MRIGIAQHLHVLDHASFPARIIYVNAFYGVPRWLRRLNPDVIVFHTTFLCMRWSHLFSGWKWNLRWIADIECEKIALPQDEYDHSEVLDEWLYELGATAILSNFGAAQRSTLYPLMHSRASFGKALTGYVDETLVASFAKTSLPMERRPFDIVYRASHLPYWFGSQGQLKHQVGTVVAERAPRHELMVDISTRAEDTILGDAWFEFLASSRAVIGSESGSSVLDRRGEIRSQIRELLRREPDLDFAEVNRRMPPGWDDFAFFAISPRHFEAISTRTCSLLVEGTYDGILEPDRHYLSIRRDFSNLDDVLERVRDHAALQVIADRAYTEIVASGEFTYEAFARDLERFLGAEQRRGRLPVSSRPWLAVGNIVGLQQRFSRRRPRLLSRVLSIPRQAWVRGAVALRLAVRQPGLRSLLRAYAQIGAGAETPSRGRVLADTLRLGLVASAQAADLRAGPSFRLTAELQKNDTVLMMKSVAPGEAAGSVPLFLEPQQLENISRIVWDHSEFGAYLPYAISRWRWISIALGERGEYDFDALTALARLLPVEVADALNGALGSPPRRRSLSMSVLRHPVTYTRLALRMTRLARRIPAHVLTAYVRKGSVRQAAPPRLVLQDLLRLGILERINATPALRCRVEVTYDQATQTVTAMTRVVADGDLGSRRSGHANGRPGETSAELRRLVWDHSAVGTSVPCLLLDGSQLPVSLGPHGVYVFEGLNALAGRYPQDAWRLLSQLLED